MAETKLAISVLEEPFAVCRLSPDSPIPDWAVKGVFFSVTRTRDELSVVLPEGHIPGGIAREGGWRCLRLGGPFDLTAVGILASVLTPLAQAQISIFALSTCETDYVLVKGKDLARAIRALVKAGHPVKQ
jgi:hypothetical protein